MQLKKNQNLNNRTVMFKIGTIILHNTEWLAGMLTYLYLDILNFDLTCCSYFKICLTYTSLN